MNAYITVLARQHLPLDAPRLTSSKAGTDGPRISEHRADHFRSRGDRLERTDLDSFAPGEREPGAPDQGRIGCCERVNSRDVLRVMSGYLQRLTLGLPRDAHDSAERQQLDAGHLVAGVRPFGRDGEDVAPNEVRVPLLKHSVARAILRDLWTADDGIRSFNQTAEPAQARVARAGVTSAVLYHYYESKEHLYEDILNERMTALHERLAAANDVTLEPVERITNLYGAFLDQFYDEGSGGTFVLRELLGLGAERFKETVGARDAQTRSYLRHALLEAMEAGTFRRVDSVLCSMAFTAMLNSFARRHALGATISRDAAREQITDVYLAGLRPTAGS